MISGVYCIKNTVDNKVYVGSSKDLMHRKIHHFSDLRCGRHTNSYLQNAFKKYGESAFKFCIMEQTPIYDLKFREQYWIDHLQGANRNCGYNLSPFAERPTPWLHKRHHSEATKLKMSLVKRGKQFTDTHKHNLSVAHKGQVSHFKGKKFTPEQIQKIKDGLKRRFPDGKRPALQGRKLSAETIKKRTETRRRNNNGKY